jgi:outer membrane immunogenic protein
MLATAAFAADLPPRNTQVPDMPLKAVRMAPDWNWTGFYLGGYAGVGLNRSHGADTTGVFNGEIDFLGTGVTAGATAGYNWQFDPRWLAGIEGDIGYLGLSHNAQEYGDPNLRTNQKTSWLGTARLRLGFTNGPSLAYITGGAAWVNSADLNSNLAGNSFVENTKTRSGYVYGSGVETRLGGNWTAKAETLYVDAGHGDPLAINGFIFAADRHRYAIQRFGVNYLFNGPQQPMLTPGDWQGFYIGGVGGGAVTQTRLSPTDAVAGEFGNNGNGYSLGGIAGYNWQFAPFWVAGVEGDVSWLGIDRSVNDYNNVPALYAFKTRWVATARGRLGYSTGPALLYVTGGGAWVNYKESWDIGGGPATSAKTKSGYTVGGGIESVMSLLGPGWTSRTEYLYVDAGKGDTLAAAPGPVSIAADHKFHLFRSAVVYHLGR